MITSVALCTYNGAPYLLDQLQSLANQSQLPGELIICDDGSVDQTVAMAEIFATQSPFPIHIYQNPTTLGVTRNFERAITLCSGDVIFLCDQDDVWTTMKIEQTCDFLRYHPQAKAVFSNATLLNADGLSLDKTIWEVNFFNKLTRDAWQSGLSFDISLLSNRIPGCVLAIRRSLLATALPFPHPTVYGMHDWWLVLAASASDSLLFLDQTLVGYRQHSGQLVGTLPRKTTNPVLVPTTRPPNRQSRKLSELLNQIQFLTEVHQYFSYNGDVPPSAIRKVEAYRDHLCSRYQARTMSIARVGPILVNLWKGHYHQYKRPGTDWSDPWRTVISDLIT